MPEETLRSKYWLGAVLVPGLVLALTFVVARLMPTRESDWLGGGFMLLAFAGTGGALLSSIVLTFVSVRKGETLCGLAVVSCLAYIGLFLKTVL